MQTPMMVRLILIFVEERPNDQIELSGGWEIIHWLEL